MNIIRCFLNKKYLLSALSIILSASTILPMDPQQEREYVFVRTKDGAITPVERWCISQMKTLLVLLEHQKGENDRQNPLNASMITSDELDMLKFALRASAEQVFEQYFMDLAKTDGLLEEIKDKGQKIRYTLGEGRVRMLVNAAEKVEAQGIVALCGSYYLPPDMQKLLASHMIIPVTEFLKKKIFRRSKEIFSLRSHIDEDHFGFLCCLFSHDATKIYIGLSDGVVEVWDVSTKKLLMEYKSPNFNILNSISLSGDGQLCAAGGHNATLGDAEIVIWNTTSGELIKKLNLNLQGSIVNSLAFNPMNNNHIVFTCKDRQSPYVLDIETGAIRSLIGYNEPMKRVSFSSDGTTILGFPDRYRHGSIALWDSVSRNLVIQVPHHADLDLTTASFYQDARKIIITGIDFSSGTNRRLVKIGRINNNSYTEDKFYVDKFFPGVHKQYFGWIQDFFVKANAGFTKIAICSKYALNNQPDDGSSLVICDNKFDTVLFNEYFYNSDIKAFEWSPHDKWVAIIKKAHGGNKRELMLMSLSDKDEEVLEKLPHVSIAQARLLYQLYCGRLSGLRLGTKETYKDNRVFMEIPLEIRELVLKHLLYDRSTGREEECMGNECVIL